MAGVTATCWSGLGSGLAAGVRAPSPRDRSWGPDAAVSGPSSCPGATLCCFPSLAFQWVGVSQNGPRQGADSSSPPPHISEMKTPGR